MRRRRIPCAQRFRGPQRRERRDERHGPQDVSQSTGPMRQAPFRRVVVFCAAGVVGGHVDTTRAPTARTATLRECAVVRRLGGREV